MSPMRNDLPANREKAERDAAIARGQDRISGRLETADTEAEQFVRAAGHQVFTALADNVRDYAVFLMDPDGVIRYWGEGARLMKWWSKEQAVGAHLRFLYPDGGSEDGTAEDHLKTAAENREYTGEGQRVRNDHSTFWAGVTLTALRDDAGTLLGFVKVTRDFSARRAIEDALKAGQAAAEAQRVAEQANELKTLFIAGISHEIRAPLNAMMGFLQMLTHEGERQQAHAARVLQSGTQLQQVIDNILDLTRLESGRIAVNNRPALLGDAIKAVLPGIERQAATSGVKFENSVSGSAGETPYWGDPSRVEQILRTLLSAAVSFGGRQITLSGGTTERTVNPELIGSGPWVYLRVEVAGSEVGPERLQTLFEPFDSTPIDTHPGAALGLPISRRLARLMGGDIVARGGARSGWEFVVSLPIAKSGTVPR
jgi:PAS domain S-box-containing protein